MALTDRQLTLATLERQHLLRRSDAPWRDVVRSIGAIQAQEPASPYLTLAVRSSTFDADEMDAALDDGSLVKCSAMRLTLHLMDATDHGWARAAMMRTLHAGGLADRRWTDTGLSRDDADRFATELAERASTPIGKAEIDELMVEFVGSDPPPGLWRALRYIAPIRHAADPTQPWRFARTPRFVAAPAPHLDEAEATGELLQRYLAAFGPASLRDAAQFTLLRQPVLRAAVEHLGDRLRTVTGPSGDLFDVVDGRVPDHDTAPAPVRLLPMWDSTMLAYADRSRIIPDEHRAQVIRRNGDCLPTVLVDGHVAGVWRLSADPGPSLELTMFDRPPDETVAGALVEAERLQQLVAPRDPDLYGRFRRWWPQLDGHTVRVPLDGAS